jgi:hypothetical protein
VGGAARLRRAAHQRPLIVLEVSGRRAHLAQQRKAVVAQRVEQLRPVRLTEAGSR